MQKVFSSHIKAILQALLVTFLWSTSFVIIKLGIDEIPPLTFAGFRYFIAFICLLLYASYKRKFSEIKDLTPGDWKRLLVLGIFFYVLTQGIQFVGLSMLSAVTVSLMLNFTPVVVAVMGIVILSEVPTKLQWSGAVLFIIGTLIFFYPLNIPSGEMLGLGIMLVGVIANATAAILGRGINKAANISPLIVTIVSMGFGSILLLAAGLTFESTPVINFRNIIYILWLSVINTALAFTLWNLTLRTLSALESSIINNTMLVQIAILAWIFLGEPISLNMGIGMVIAVIGAYFVQVKLKKKKLSSEKIR